MNVPSLKTIIALYIGALAAVSLGYYGLLLYGIVNPDAAIYYIWVDSATIAAIVNHIISKKILAILHSRSDNLTNDEQR
ncbi:MAG: hypothetical protein ACD_58C00010G0009 [uncultured bacterium]|nr:MAG: hypothetical protein ACD_58C00010G0009 [uncultured bacterium]